jgi:hypothetical protein
LKYDDIYILSSLLTYLEIVDDHLEESEHAGGKGNVRGISIEHIRYRMEEELLNDKLKERDWLLMGSKRNEELGVEVGPREEVCFEDYSFYQ